MTISITLDLLQLILKLHDALLSCHKTPLMFKFFYQKEVTTSSLRIFFHFIASVQCGKAFSEHNRRDVPFACAFPLRKTVCSRGHETSSTTQRQCSHCAKHTKWLFICSSVLSMAKNINYDGIVEIMRR